MNTVDEIRDFNRFYTKHLGLINNKIMKTDFSLAEARILFELSTKGDIFAVDLVRELEIDPSYLSRIIKKFEKNNWLIRRKSEEDSRRYTLALTEQGGDMYESLKDIMNTHALEVLDNLTPDETCSLIASMKNVQNLISGVKTNTAFTIRDHEVGDIGYLSYMHGKFYSEEYGLDISFDSYVSGAMAKFIDYFNPKKDKLWVVEMHGRIVGSIAIVNVDGDTAQLRWFILAPEAQGEGIGKKLMESAIKFCKSMGYRKIILWTFSDLNAARSLYKKFGFNISKTEKHEIWGQYLEEELWEFII